MHYLKPKGTDPTKGELYELSEAGKTLVQKDFNLKTASTQIKVEIVCQWIGEGQSLNILDTIEDAPDKVEFLYWIEAKPEWNTLFQIAKNRRFNQDIENLVDELSNAEGDLEKGKLLEGIMKIRAMAKSADELNRTVVNTKVYPAKAITDLWYKKENDN